jgi:hypothetical protein
MNTRTAALALIGAVALAPSIAAAGTDDQPEPVTVEVLEPVSRSRAGVTIGVDVTMADDLADQLDIEDPSRFVVWITMKPELDGTFAHLDDCPGVPGSADDIAPGTRRIPVC